MHTDNLFHLLQQHQIPIVEKTYARNIFISKAGDINTNIYWINSGSIRIFISDNEVERNIRFGYQNNFIVAMDSFLEERASNLYIQTIKQTSVFILQKKDFVRIMDTNLELRLYWQKTLESLIIQQLEREVDLLLQNPLERYNRVLSRSPQVFQHIPHKHIANYLRMTPETLSRLKKS